MKRRWALCTLASCASVVVRRTDGTEFEPALRQAAPLNVPQTWFDLFLASLCILVHFFTRSVVVLPVSGLAGEGLRFRAWRGVYRGIPFIVKIPHSQDAARNEWNALTSCLPRNPTIASRLPIATHFGLFKTGALEVILTSDNGIALDQLVEGYEDLR